MLKGEKVNTDLQRATKELAARAKLIDVARLLGMHISYPRSGNPQVLCPFHDDHTPSMSLYDDHYHCFACNAHGNVFELIKAIHKVQFIDARKWLADKYGVRLPTHEYTGDRPQNARALGLNLAFQHYKQQRSLDTTCLDNWAKLRGFDSRFLKSAEVFGAKGNKLSRQLKSAENFEALDGLVEAGLLYKPKSDLPIAHPYQDIYYTDRIIFTIRTAQGDIAGFAGRSVGDDKPKYLFSKGLPKGELLYRLDMVRNKLISVLKAKITESVHLYVVEGLLDALRLESLGLSAVAILGSRMTESQTGLLLDLAKDLNRLNKQLIVHLFLDSDEAGRKGTTAAIPSLWSAARESHFVLDIIKPKSRENDIAHDPDEYLRDVFRFGDSSSFLQDSVVSGLSFLVSELLDCQPSDIDVVWNTISQTERLACMRSINYIGDSKFWKFTFARLLPSSVFLGANKHDEPAWLQDLKNFLLFEEPDARIPYRRPVADIAEVTPPLGKERLSHALKLATSSLQRRDMPVDEGSWLRMNLASDVFEEHFKRMLSLGSSHNEPFAAAKIPKPNGEFRLKALPCHEDLVLQQYMMNALLRDNPQSHRFLECIPAVRFSRYKHRNRSRITGLVKHEGDEDIASFAYQIDMDVLEGRTPPGNTGMFRHYAECWREFINYLESKLTSIGVKDIHVMRLDIRKYYDLLPLFTVRDALLEPLKKALGSLENATQCAPEFRPDVTDPEERARLIVDWLCKQSFGYRYYNPSDGLPRDYEWKDRGVPQGPDLSAYLANIALFPLDKTIKEHINSLNASIGNGQDQNVRAVYARYVDDLILITDSSENLTKLRIHIENELSKLGLELNKKTAPLTSMTQADVRQWLTDERGGLGVSAPSRTPTNAFETLVNDCIESGHVDRSDSLLVLHSPWMDDPDTEAEDVINGVKASRNSQELRYGDLCCAAKHIWRVVIEKAPNRASLDLLAKTFYDYWNKTGRPTKSSDDEVTAFHDVCAILAALDGIERFLCSRTDRNPTFSMSARQKNEEWRTRLARAVISGDIQTIKTLAGKRETSFAVEQGIRHMLELKHLSLIRTSCLVLPKDTTLVNNSFYNHQGRLPLPPPIMRHLCSVAAVCKNIAILEQATMIPDARETASGPVLLLHNAISRLQIGDAYSNTIDPMDGLKGQFDSVQREFSVFNDSEFATQTLKLWLPHNKSNQSTHNQQFLQPALRSFINIAKKNRMADYLGKRPDFGSALLDGADPIPVPPGIDYPGIIGWNREKDTFVRVDFVDNETTFGDLDGITWEAFDRDDTNGREWTRLRAAAKGWQPLIDIVPLAKDICVHENAPRFCASLFLGLQKALHTNEENVVPCAAPHVLVREFNREKMSFSAVGVLGYQLSKNSFDTLAFIRRGWSLAQESVSAQYADIWRIGSTVADITGFLEYCHADSSMRLTNRSYVFDCGLTPTWAREALFRTAFFRLQGKKVRPGILRIDQSSNLPMTVARAVKQLNGFPSRSEGIGIDIPQLRYVLSSSAESRAMALRMANDAVYGGPGGAAFFLMHFASHYFRDDDVLASLLPNPPETMGTMSLPKRRAVLGYHELARRVGMLLEDPQTLPDLSGLEALAVGLRILALTENVRAQVLERLHLLSDTDLQPFEESLGLVSFGIDAQSVLIAEEIEHHQSALIKRLIQLKLGLPTTFAGLDKITPLGWWALLIAMCGFSEIPFGKATIGNVDRSKCETITKALILWDNHSKDFPWEGLLSTIKQWTEDFTHKAFEILAELDHALGVELLPKENLMFTYSPNYRKGIVNFSLPTGRLTLDSWRFLFASTGSAIRDVEFIRDPNDKNIKISFWTETRVGGELVAISAMSTALATLAGIHGKSQPTMLEATTSVDVCVADASPAKAHSLETITEVISLPDSLTVQTEIASGVGDAVSVASAISNRWKDVISRMQHDSWKARQEDTRDVASHVRVALLQLEIDSSYEHPVSELCCKSRGTSDADGEIGKLIEIVQKDMTKWDEAATNAMISKTRSCAEYRRRKILEEVLKACNSFKVDILVLPEYSVRPETVEWIAKALPSFARNISVWAGTFRKPPYMIGECADIFADVPDWAAPLPVIFPGDPSTSPGDIKVTRWKKYPAAGLGEVFNPYKSEIQPISWMLKNEPGFRDHRDLICELICSEIFLLSSPSNLLSLGVRLRALSHKFGLPGMDSPKGVMEDEVLPDCKSFSLFTSLQTPRKYRRHPIIIVPALTTRPVDWAVTGQAGYLASGLTTVFCNAVHANGKGQSCFIGTDCWDNSRRKTKLDRHNPQLGPYHGVIPGIYTQTSEDRGWLSGTEQALVIADIDPILSCGGDPSPESLGSSLTLVAHLPIIESLQVDLDKKTNGCRCSWEHNDLSQDFDALMQSMGERLSAVSGHTSIDDHQPEILEAELLKLANMARLRESDSDWLKKRANAYRNHHAGDPVRWPPPVALDWLCIELDYDMEDMPIIGMPEYRKDPGEMNT